MKVTRTNGICEIGLDGGIFRYYVRRPYRPLFKLLRLNKGVEIPVNIVLSYQLYQTWFGLFIKLRINNVSFRTKKLSPITLSPVWVFDPRVGARVIQDFDQIICMNKTGVNLGLMNVSTEELASYYADKKRVHGRNQSTAIIEKTLTPMVKGAS